MVDSIRTRWRLIAAGLLGLLAPLWWTWSVSGISYFTYLALGSPGAVNRFQTWAIVHPASLIVGLATGLVLALLCREKPVSALLVFNASLLIAALALGILLVTPSAYLAMIYLSWGNALFFVGMVIVPVTVQLRRAV